jgi:hypothetical protein
LYEKGVQDILEGKITQNPTSLADKADRNSNLEEFLNLPNGSIYVLWDCDRLIPHDTKENERTYPLSLALAFMCIASELYLEVSFCGWNLPSTKR